MEKTVAVTLGGKKYLATRLTRIELRAFARLDTLLRAAPRDGDVPEIVALVDELAEIIRVSILRSGSDVPAGEAEVWPPNDVLKTSGVVLNFTLGKETSAFPDDEFPGGTRIQ